MSSIVKKMLALMADVPVIAKDQRNKAHGFSFRGIDDVYDALHPLLCRHGIICIPKVIDVHTEEYQTSKGTVMHRTLLTVEHGFFAEDGSCIAATTVGEASDAQDKSASKAMSVAYKYALFETFCIPTGEPDADADSPANPANPRSGGKRIGGPRIGDDKVRALWMEASTTAERLGVDRADIMRVVLQHFELTRTQGVAAAQYADVLAMVKDPGDLIDKPEPPADEGEGDDS